MRYLLALPLLSILGVCVTATSVTPPPDFTNGPNQYVDWAINERLSTAYMNSLPQLLGSLEAHIAAGINTVDDADVAISIIQQGASLCLRTLKGALWELTNYSATAQTYSLSELRAKFLGLDCHCRLLSTSAKSLNGRLKVLYGDSRLRYVVYLNANDTFDAIEDLLHLIPFKLPEKGVPDENSLKDPQAALIMQLVFEHFYTSLALGQLITLLLHAEGPAVNAALSKLIGNGAQVALGHCDRLLFAQHQVTTRLQETPQAGRLQLWGKLLHGLKFLQIFSRVYGHRQTIEPMVESLPLIAELGALHDRLTLIFDVQYAVYAARRQVMASDQMVATPQDADGLKLAKWHIFNEWGKVERVLKGWTTYIDIIEPVSLPIDEYIVLFTAFYYRMRAVAFHRLFTQPDASPFQAVLQMMTRHVKMGLTSFADFLTATLDNGHYYYLLAPRYETLLALLKVINEMDSVVNTTKPA